jgi:hypothetical protein
MVGDAFSSTNDFSYIYSVDKELGKWVHVLAVYDAENDNIRLYVNGALKMKANNSYDYYLDSMNELKFGHGLNGVLDEIMIFNRSLSDSEIRALYDTTSKNLSTAFSTEEGNFYSYRAYLVNSNGEKYYLSRSLLIDSPKTSPNVFLESPKNNSRLASSVEFICSLSDTNRDSQLSSVTLYWDYHGNFVADETKLVSNEKAKVIFSKSGLSDMKIVWNCYACDSSGNCGFAKENNTVFIGRNDYYVAKNGNDNNLGTLGDPFLTIQKCAQIALPGDTCYVREGIYRETVTPKNSGNENARIIFRPYNHEKVTISGANELTGWSKHSGEIYKTSMNFDLGKGKNQVFVNGKMMFLSRWPNTPSLDVMRPVTKTIEGGSNITGQVQFSLNNVNLTQEDGFWKNAIVFLTYSPRYWTHTGIVHTSVPGEIIFNMTRAGYGRYPSWGSFFLMDKLEILDSEGEWFYDNETRQLYLWQIGGGNPEGRVEAKARMLAFNLSGKEYITIEGFHIFSSGIHTNRYSNNILIDSINASYVNHYTLFGSTGNLNTYEGATSGILLDGYDNILNNSHIRYAACNAVGIRRERNKVLNSEIHDVNYIGAYCAAITTQGPRTKDVEIIGNKLYNSGREVVINTDSQRLKLLDNEMFNSCVGGLTADLGITYANSYDYDNSEIAYNRVYNSTYGGIYFDYRGANVLIHHNVIYNVPYGMILHSPQNFTVDHNTVSGYSFSIAGRWWVQGEDPSLGSAIFRNNLFLSNVLMQSYYTFENNLDRYVDPVFVDKLNHDYHLRDSSPAIDSGIELGYKRDIEGNVVPMGEGVDIGAYESPYFKSQAGPVAHYSFEVGANDSRGVYHGEFKENAKTVLDLDKGNVLSLNGNGDFVNLPKNVLAGRKEASIMGWFKTTDNRGSIIMQYDNSQSYVYFLNIYDGKVEGCMSGRHEKDCYSPDLTSKNSYNDNSWHHAAFVSTGAEVILYIDGVQVNRTIKSVNMSTGAYINAIGLQGYDGTHPLRAGFLNGLIDDVIIYGRALSSDEILVIYNDQKPKVLSSSGVSMFSVWSWSKSPFNGQIIKDFKRYFSKR